MDFYSAEGGSDMALALVEARRAAGPEILDLTLMIPIILIVAFGGLVMYMRGRKPQAI